MSQLKREITIEEFNYWIAYNKIDPFDSERMDLRFAMLGCVNTNLQRTSRSAPAKLEDFILKFDAPVEKEDKTKDAQNKLVLWKNLYSANGGKIIRKKKNG